MVDLRGNGMLSWLQAVCLVLLTTAAVAPVGAQSFLEWKGLTRGPHPVSFTTVTAVDTTRTLRAPRDYFGSERPGYGRRPLHIAIWQPALSSASGTEMTYGDYLPLLAWDTGPHEEGAGGRQVAELRYIQAVTPLAGPPDVETVDRLMHERVRARRDAVPAPGKFPVLIYAPGSGYPAFDNSVLAEFLASHGYIVVAVPSTGPDGGRMRGDVFGMEAQTRDLEFLVGYVQTLPQADAERIATAGFSWGGLPSVLLALRNTRVKAVISLDSVVRDPVSLALARTHPEFRPERLRVPVLVFTTTPENSIPAFADESFLDQARYAEITRAVVPGSVHHDLASMSSLLRRVSQRGRGKDWTAATAGYEAVCKLTLQFLDSRLGSAGAFEAGEGVWVQTAARVSTRQAAKAPPTPEDFLEVLEAYGPQQARDMVRAAARDAPDAVLLLEGAINQAGYDLLGAGRTADAITVLALGVETSPDSYNASDSLGEAYLAAGDLDKARACYLDAKSKLAKTKDLPAEMRARFLTSAEKGLAEVEARRKK